MRRKVKFNRSTGNKRRSQKEALSISEVSEKQVRAWETLFKGMTVEQMIEECNNVWIDPRYKLVIVKSETLAIPLEEET